MKAVRDFRFFFGGCLDENVNCDGSNSAKEQRKMDLENQIRLAGHYGHYIKNRDHYSGHYGHYSKIDVYQHYVFRKCIVPYQEWDGMHFGTKCTAQARVSIWAQGADAQGYDKKG